MEVEKFPSTFLSTLWLWLPGVRRAVPELSDRAFAGREDAATSPERLHVSLFDDRPRGFTLFPEAAGVRDLMFGE